MKQFDCCLCGELDVKGWGNNPHPFGPHEGRCCDGCNMEFVLPQRLRNILMAEDTRKVDG
jgi:hypothetical protein